MEPKKDVRQSFTWVYFDLKFKSLDTALKLQAKEYERRLDALNGENEKIAKILDSSIPREVFDRTISSMNEKYERMHNEQGKRIAELEEYKTKQEGSSKVILYLVGVAITIMIGIAIKLFTSKL